MSFNIIGITRSILSLDDLWIDFAATRRNGDASLKAIESLKAGDVLNINSNRTSDGRARMDLRNANGVTVACLSSKGVDKWSSEVAKIIKIQVMGVHIRKANDGNQTFEGRVPLRDEWGIPICEIYTRNGSVNLIRS